VSGGVVQLEVAATDSSGIHHVTFTRWDAANQRTVEIAVDYSPPYRVSLDISTLNMDWNKVNADATDNAGNWAGQHIWINRTAATGVVEGSAFHDANGNDVKDPGEAGLLGAVLMLKLFPANTESYTAASGADGAFRFDSVAPGMYTLSEKSPPRGYFQNTWYSVTLLVQANGLLSGFNLGHQAELTPTPTATNTPSVDPGDTTPPTGRIIDPLNGVTIATCPILIQAQATDSGSGVASVRFWAYYNGTWADVGTDTNGSDGWNASWDCRSVPTQDVLLSTWMDDNAGNRTMNPGGYVTISLCPGCGAANSSWPLFRHDLQHTGRSPYSGPSHPIPKRATNRNLLLTHIAT